MKFVNTRPFQRGTWADLYLAELVDTGQTVIIKMLRPTADPSVKRSFLRELKIVTRAIHARVLRALFHRDDAVQTYYVMPYFSGGQLTPRAGRMTYSQLRVAAKQICEGIAAMHAADIIHGDVKPDNVMVTKEGNLQVGDPLGNGAGCTVMYSENCGGTPGYWAPEIAGGRGPMSKQGDVYSIGATIFHLATGIRPEDGKNLDPWLAAAQVPADLREIILAATHISPIARPTVAQLLRTLNGEARAPAAAPNPTPAHAPNDIGKSVLAIGGLLLGVFVLGSILEGT